MNNLLKYALLLFICSFSMLTSAPINSKGVLYFYSKNDPYYELTNFYLNYRHDGLHHVFYKNNKWKTSEHAFQAEKFNYSSIQAQKVRQQIAHSNSGREAFEIAQKNSHLARSDWLQIRDSVMLDILRSKFSDPHLSKVLKKTGNRYLVEASPYDAYWGYGPNKQGKNQLGKLLMQVRKERFGF